MPALTFIVGAPRSGTSAITRAFEACGAELGIFNETLREHRAAKQWIKRMLRIRRLDPSGQHPLPPEPFTVSAAEMRSLEKAIGRAEVVKDVKLLWVWPQLVTDFPAARFVYVQRNPMEVARSCIRTDFMRAYGRHHAQWFRYARAYQKQAEALHRAAPERTSIVRLSDYLEGEEGPLRGAVEASGLRWHPRQVRKVLRPERWHGG